MENFREGAFERRIGVGEWEGRFQNFSRDLRGLILDSSEIGLEVFDNIAVTNWLYVTPDIQVIEPAGKAATPRSSPACACRRDSKGSDLSLRRQLRPSLHPQNLGPHRCLRARGDKSGLVGSEYGLEAPRICTHCGLENALVCETTTHCLQAVTAKDELTHRVCRDAVCPRRIRARCAGSRSGMQHTPRPCCSPKFLEKAID
jgi:hypothetical protein